jgi:hypothetical protein
MPNTFKVQTKKRCQKDFNINIKKKKPVKSGFLNDNNGTFCTKRGTVPILKNSSKYKR